MKHPEREIQEAVVQHLRLRGVPGLVFFHVPNAPRSAITGKLLKRMGMLAGVSDLILLYQGKFHALELKAPGKKPKLAQFDFMYLICAAGGDANWCDSLDDAIRCLQKWNLLIGHVA